MKYQIALTMKEIMLKNGRNTVWYGDLELIEECAELSGVKIQHPKKTIKYILDNLDRSPCFTKGYIIADIDGSKRRYRCFKLK
ncbi:hypothetical protein [Vescimonas sp.]|uniref:hypothetical protein n=1 Tax=Vescimonas sp. TaxID=2892404 RepID=UPI00307BADE3